ncbi:MAG: hypothetical protein ACI89U_002414, partial [Gammaproteobacteria bacterium]
QSLRARDIQSCRTSNFAEKSDPANKYYIKDLINP